MIKILHYFIRRKTMMKKLTKLALFAAATAFLLAGFPACSSDDDDDPTLTGIKITVDARKVKTTYMVNEKFTPTGITVTATYSDGSTKDVTTATEWKATYNGKPFTTEAAGKFEVELTATYKEKTDSTTCTINVEKDSANDPDDPSVTDPDDPSVTDPLKESGTFEEDITELDFATATTGLTDTLNGDTEKNGKYTIKDGTTLADGYFKIVQSEKSSTTYYTDKARTKISAIELDKQSNNTYIEFTVTGSAVVTVSAKSTGSNNTSYVEIVKADMEGTFDTATAVSGTSNATKIEKTCPAGTYRIVVVTDDSKKSLARIESSKAVQTVN